jgi:hypothetical protein
MTPNPVIPAQRPANAPPPALPEGEDSGVGHKSPQIAKESLR